MSEFIYRFRDCGYVRTVGRSRSRRQRTTVLAKLVDSEAFTVAVASLVVAIGLGSLGLLCMLEFLRDGQLEICMLAGLVTLGAVVVPLAKTNRAIRELRRRYREIVRLTDGRGGDHPGRWKPDG